MPTLLAAQPAPVNTRQVYQGLVDVYLPIGVAVFAIFLLTTIALVLRGRRRPLERVSTRFNNERLEGSYAVLLTCIVAVLLWLTFSAEHQTDTAANRVRPYMTVNVLASKWEWTFSYPRYHVTVRSGTTGMRTFLVPVGEPIRFTLSSADVIHEFWIPELRWKHDLIYGKTQYQTLTFPTAGLFQGQCGVFCGLRHPDMLFETRAVSLARFQAWAAGGGRGS
jgi:cytochrome c oxidase subunit 2